MRNFLIVPLLLLFMSCKTEKTESVLEEIRQSNRSSVFCPQCQVMPKETAQQKLASKKPKTKKKVLKK